MAKLSGKNGKVDIAGTVNGVKSWSCDYTGEDLNTTDFGDSGHETHIIGTDGWGGSFEGNFNQEALEALGACTIKLYVDATKYITGPAVVLGWHLGTPIDGLVTVAYDYIGNGDLTLTNLV